MMSSRTLPMWQALLLLAIIGAAAAKPSNASNPAPATGLNPGCVGKTTCFQPNPETCNGAKPACSVAADAVLVTVGGKQYRVTPFLGTWGQLQANYKVTDSTQNPLWNMGNGNQDNLPLAAYQGIYSALSSTWGAGFVNNQTGKANNPPSSSPFCPFGLNGGDNHVEAVSYEFDKNMGYGSPPAKTNGKAVVDPSEIQWWCGWEKVEEGPSVPPPTDGGSGVGDPHLKVRGWRGFSPGVRGGLGTTAWLDLKGCVCG